MAIRTQREVRQRAPVWLGGFLALNLALMSYSARDPVTNQPVVRTWTQALASLVQRPIATVGGAGANVFRRIGSLRTAVAENEELKRHVAEIEAEMRDARIARSENERLKSLLALREEVSYNIVPVRVIARDPSAWFNSVIINRGSLAGIDLDMPVATRDGIVGRVIGVSPVTAKVTLITDERAAAGAIIGQPGTSNALGAVRGLGRDGLLEMRYVSGLEPVKEGDYVVTTGQDGIYPSGLNVGTVVHITQGSATTPHVIHVKPGARLDSLEEVAVLQYRPPQNVPMEKTLPNVDKGKK